MDVITDASGDVLINEDGTVDVLIDDGPTLRFDHERSLRSWLSCIGESLPSRTPR